MASVQRPVHMGRKTRKLLSIVIPVAVVLVAGFFVWRPWHTQKPYVVLDPWVHVTYSHAELQARQKLADSGKHPDLLDPQKALASFVATDLSGGGSFDLGTQNLDLGHVQSVQDKGKDPKNGDRLFLVTFSQQKNAVVFRLRQVGGAEAGRIWTVIGYLFTSESSSPASYSATWQESDGPSGQ